MPEAKLKVACLLIATGAGLIGIPGLRAQQSPGPILPSAKISPDNPLGLTIDHATLSVKDIDREEAFLRNTFGFKEIASGNFGPDVKFRTLAIAGVFRIDLVEHAGSVRHSAPGAFDMEQGWVHIVFKSSDLNVAYKQLESKQARMRLTRDAGGMVTEIYVTDPEGNEIEVQR